MERYIVKFISNGISVLDNERTFKTLDEAKVYLYYFFNKKTAEGQPSLSLVFCQMKRLVKAFSI